MIIYSNAFQHKISDTQREINNHFHKLFFTFMLHMQAEIEYNIYLSNLYIFGVIFIRFHNNAYWYGVFKEKENVVKETIFILI